jgi:hypothetical protein
MSPEEIAELVKLQNNASEGLEPAARVLFEHEKVTQMEMVISMSQAISLKRIADALEFLAKEKAGI